MSVSNIQIVEDTTNMSHIINKYTKLDPHYLVLTRYLVPTKNVLQIPKRRTRNYLY